jgi:hypothetical protein
MDMEEALKQLGPEVINQLKIQLGKHKASGALEASLKFEIEKKKNQWILKIHANKSLEYIMLGRRPYPNDPKKTPPIEPIRKWVGQKGIKFGNLSDIGMAYAIATSIRIKGIKGKPDLIKNSLKEALIKDKLILEMGSKEEIQKLVSQVIVAINTEKK